MEFFILALSAIIISFFICFEVQYPSLAKENTDVKLKAFLPTGKENVIMFFIVQVMLIICIVFLELYYENSLIDDIKLILLFTILCPAAYFDWNEHIIPNRIIAKALCLRIIIFVFELIFMTTESLTYCLGELISSLLIFVIGFLCSLIIKDSIGMGDVKLVSVMALFLGASGIISAVFISLLVSFIYCIIALIAKKKHRKDIIPFAPSLLLGTYISICLFEI